MIEIERSSSVSVHQQVVTAIRFRIANGRFRVGDRLPATRKLATQLGISFHTVRKAYLTLQDEGLVESRKGSGFVVLDANPLDKSERMERGAAIMASALKEVIGLGLDESELEYIFEEQINLLDSEDEQFKIVIATPFRELGQACALHVSNTFQKDCSSCSLDEIEKHADADFLLVPFKNVKQVLSGNPSSDVIAVGYEINEEALAAISRLLEHETLGLVTRYSDAVAPLLSDLRDITSFSGQVLAVSAEEGDAYLSSLIRQSELFVYTSGAERAVRPLLDRSQKHVKLTLSLAPSSIERMRGIIP